MPEGEGHGILELTGVVRLRDADRGAEPGRLDEAGKPEGVLDRIAGPQGDVSRDRDAAVAQHLLEQILVHAQRRGQHAGVGVAHA